MIVGTDFPMLSMKLDTTSPGPCQIGGDGYLTPIAQRQMVGWTCSGYTGRAPPSQQEILAGKFFLSQEVAMMNNSFHNICRRLTCQQGLSPSLTSSEDATRDMDSGAREETAVMEGATDAENPCQAQDQVGNPLDNCKVMEGATGGDKPCQTTDEVLDARMLIAN